MKKLLLILLILWPVLLAAQEQKESQSFWEKNFDLGAGVGAGISSNGFGIHGIFKLNDIFKIRLGYDYMKLKWSDRNFSSGSRQYRVKPTWETGGFSAILNATVYKSFYVSAGIVQTEMDLELKMKLRDPIKFGDIEYTPDEVGEYNLHLKPKNKVAPYLGIGWDAKIFKNKRWALNIEGGAYYINSLKAKSSGTYLLAVNGEDGNESMIEVNDVLGSISWTKFYPVGKIGISYMFY